MLRPPPRPTGATSRPGLRLTLGPVRIDVQAADPEVLIWLAEFLEPAFAAQPLASLPQSADEADHVVVLEESLSDPESILRAGSTAAREEWDVSTNVSIREKSLAFFGKLSRTLEQSPFDRIRTIEECEREGVLAQMPVDSNVLRATISPAQLGLGK